MNQLSFTFNSSSCTPIPNIDLEVWQNSGSVSNAIDSIENLDQLSECGEVMPGGRFGWFIPQNEIFNSESNEYQRLNIDHLDFANESFIENFIIPDEILEEYILPNVK